MTFGEPFFVCFFPDGVARLTSERLEYFVAFSNSILSGDVMFLISPWSSSCLVRPLHFRGALGLALMKLDEACLPFLCPIFDGLHLVVKVTNEVLVHRKESFVSAFLLRVTALPKVQLL